MKKLKKLFSRIFLFRKQVKYSNTVNREFNITNNLADYVSSFKYINKYEIINMFDTDFSNFLLKKKSFDKEMQILAKKDKKNYLYIYSLLSFKLNNSDIIFYLSSKEHSEYIKAYIVINRIVDLPTNIYDFNIAFTWFMNKEIREPELNVFNYTTTQSILDKIQTEFPNLINIQLKNLLCLWKNYESLNSYFTNICCKIIQKNDYLNDLHFEFAKKALITNDALKILLEKIILKIDPFSKETQYSKWLKDIKKFEFIFKLVTEVLPENDKIRKKYELKSENLFPLIRIDNSL